MALAPEIQHTVNTWLTPEYDADTQDAIRALQAGGHDEALTDAFYRTLEFGTGGLRGIMGPGSNRMNRYTLGMATQGLCNYLKHSFPNQEIKVAIAHDSRNNSPEFAQIAAGIFSGNGITVYLFDALRPTPELSFAIRELGCQSGCVITASHNPKEYNGYKVYWNDGAQVVAPHDKNIIVEVNRIASVREVNFEADPSKIISVGADIDARYFARAKQLSIDPAAIQRQHDLNIVYTPIHGSGITLVPGLLREFGFTNVRVVEAQATPNGDFPTVHSPNPEEQSAMQLALDQAQATNADLVLATDPDADRVGVGVRNDRGDWVLLNGNQTAALLTHYLLSARHRTGQAQQSTFGNEQVADSGTSQTDRPQCADFHRTLHNCRIHCVADREQDDGADQCKDEAEDGVEQLNGLDVERVQRFEVKHRQWLRLGERRQQRRQPRHS